MQLQQNSTNWLEWRRLGIGASDVPIILGLSKYKTKYELFKEKTNSDPVEDKGGYILDLGHQIEKEARKIYEIMIGDVCDPLCATHSQLDWARASLDGYDKKNNCVWECKLVGQKEFDSKQISPKFYAQIQWQMFVTGIPNAVLFLCLHTKKGLKDFLKLDLEYDKNFINENFGKISAFYEMVKNKEFTAEDGENFEIVDSRIQRLLQEYRKVKFEIAGLELNLKLLEKEILDNTKNNQYFDCYKIVEAERKGSIDYSKIEILKDINLEEYRKPSIKYKTIKIKEEKKDD